METEPLTVQVIYPYKGKNNDELCLKKGDIITVTQKDEGWWEGTLNGNTGWFPSNFVKEYTGVSKPETIQQKQYKLVVFKDLVDSERAHVTELEGLVTDFLQPLETEGILSQDEYFQLTGNINEVLEIHQELLRLIETEEKKPGQEQRLGRLFLTWAPRIKAVHQAYCSLHPKAVLILDKYRDELMKYMEARGAASPGILVLTTLLSKPFRRLAKYSGMLQELERHIEENHPDRGDTQRSLAVYKEIYTLCMATRRQKELELQILTGPVRGWEGPSLSTFGEVLQLTLVTLGSQQDRYLVLFPSTLLILSISHRLSAFVYEGKLPLSGITVTKLEDNDQHKNAFEISAPMIEKMVIMCHSEQEAECWVELLRSMSTNSSSSLNQKVVPSQAEFVPQPPPHRLNPRGYSTRYSVVSYKYRIQFTCSLPQETYPSAAPYAGLTKLFKKLIKQRLINANRIKQLLYPEYLSKMNITLVKIRHHKTECTIGGRGLCRSSSVIDSDSDSDASTKDKPLKQSKAVLTLSENQAWSSVSTNPFGYIRYYNPESGSMRNYESVIDYGEIASDKSIPINASKAVTHTSTVELNLQEVSTGANAGINATRPFMTCENLLNLDENLALSMQHRHVPVTRQSCPTKLVGNKFSPNSSTKIYIPSWCSSEQNIAKFNNHRKHDANKSFTTNSDNGMTHSSSLELPVNAVPLPDQVAVELLYNFDDCVTNTSELEESRTNFIDHNHKSLSCTSDQLDPPEDPEDLNHKSCMCRYSVENDQSHTSSDSGITGSITLNSPDIVNARYLPSPLKHRHNTDISCLCCNLDLRNRNVISLTNIEATDFNSQCSSMSLFGSTPHTSCQTRSSDNVSTGSAENFQTSVTCSLDLHVTSRTKGQPKNDVPEVAEVSSASNVGLVNNNDSNMQQMLDEEDLTSDKTAECSAENVPENSKDQQVFRSGLYAHWWLKAKIPLTATATRSRDDSSGTMSLQMTASGQREQSMCNKRSLVSDKYSKAQTPHLSLQNVNSNTRSWSALSFRPTQSLCPWLTLGPFPNGIYNHRLHNVKHVSYKEDGFILDVIEAYCTLNSKTRSITNSADLTIGNEKKVQSEHLLPDIVLHLQNKIHMLQNNLAMVQSQLYNEVMARCSLQNILKTYMVENCKEYADNIDWPVIENAI